MLHYWQDISKFDYYSLTPGEEIMVKISDVYKNLTEGKKTFLLILGFLFSIVFLGIGKLPEIVITPPQNWDQLETWIGQFHRLFVILPDDVMITMRVAKFFLIHGYPGFNVSDISQPSTSYILPIVLAPLFYLFPNNIALILASFLGVLAFSACGILLKKAIDIKLQILLLSVLFLNSTTLTYLFGGWDHVWQCFFVVLAYAIAYELDSERSNLTRYISIGIASALAVLFRADSIFLLSPLLVWVLVSGRDKYRYIAVVVFVVLGFVYSYFQLKWFGTLTPTTARLKTSSLPGLGYSFDYLFKCITKGSAVAFIPLLVFTFRNSFIHRKTPGLAALIGVILSCSFAFLVSDVFSFGRMFLAPLVLTIFVASRPQAQDYNGNIIGSFDTLRHKSLLPILFLLLLLAVVPHLFTRSAARVEHPLSPYLPIEYLSPTAEQLILAQYIMKHMKPSDGSVGLFYLGTTSFYMPDYAIGDFLGKADEDIAKLPVKWGPPGHNKWNTEISLLKWKPAVIPFFGVTALAKAGINEKKIKDQVDFAFWADFDLALKKRGYVFCKPYPAFKQGLYVRKDLISKFSSCQIFKNGLGES